MLPLAAADLAHTHTHTRGCGPGAGGGSSRRASKRRVRVPFLGNAFAGGSTFSSFHALQNIFSAVSPSRDPNTRCLQPPCITCLVPHHHHPSGKTLVMPGTPSPQDKEGAAPPQRQLPLSRGRKRRCHSYQPAHCLLDETAFTSA